MFFVPVMLLDGHKKTNKTFAGLCWLLAGCVKTFPAARLAGRWNSFYSNDKKTIVCKTTRSI